jgi:hypothetical protein
MLRIGIVLSVIWFVGFGGYIWFSSIQRLDDLYSLDLRACSANFDRDQNSGMMTRPSVISAGLISTKNAYRNYL